MHLSLQTRIALANDFDEVLRTDRSRVAIIEPRSNRILKDRDKTRRRKPWLPIKGREQNLVSIASGTLGLLAEHGAKSLSSAREESGTPRQAGGRLP